MSAVSQQIESDVAERIKLDPFFASSVEQGTCTVVAEPRKNLAAEAKRAVGKTGLVLVPSVERVTMLHPNVSPDYKAMLSPQVAITVIENPQLSKNVFTGLDAAERLASVFHLWRLGYLSAPFTAQGDCIVPIVDPVLNIFRVSLETAGEFSIQVSRVRAPQFSQSSGELTITCATAGAVIYYTTDGSFPGRNNSNATAYAAAFEPGYNKTVRACAYLDDLDDASASDITQTKITT